MHHYLKDIVAKVNTNNNGRASWLALLGIQLAVYVFCNAVSASANEVVNSQPYINESEQQLTKLNNLLRTQPNEAFLLTKRRRFNKIVGNFDDALRDELASKVRLQSDPVLEARLRESLSQPNEAYRLYLSVDSGNTNSRRNASEVVENRARLGVALGKYDQVIRDSDWILGGGFEDEKAGYLASKAYAQYRLGKFAQAQATINQAKELDTDQPQRLQVKLVETILLRDTGKPDLALKTVNQMQNLRPSRSTDRYLFVEEPHIFAIRASVYGLQNKPEKAQADLAFMQLLQANQPTGVDAYIAVSRNLKKAGNQKGSKACALKAMAIIDQQRKALFDLLK